MMPHFHPTEELLQAYAAGHLEEPLALLVATHSALCPQCRKQIADLERVGGALLDSLDPSAVSDSSLDAVLSQLDDAPVEFDIPLSKAQGETADLRVPQPLRDYLAGSLDEIEWRSRGPVAEVPLLPEQEAFKTRLLKIKAGAAVPQHTHEGAEITMVLSGGFTDSHGHYLRGDVAVADTSVDHRPVADPGEDCLCIAVTDAPLRLTGPVGRWLNYFVRF